jgi:hypothetical protein
MDRIAYGLSGLKEKAPRPVSVGAPGPPSLWSWSMIGRLATGDSQALEAAAPATLLVGTESVPVWLAVRSDPSGLASLLAIADGRTAAGGGPLSYRSGDTLAYPGLVTFAALGRGDLRPGAPRLLVDSGSAGVPAGNRVRLAILAWSLQSGRLLNTMAPSARLRWHLSPRERLERLAPFASWDAPRPVMARGSVLWIVHGYLASAGFPGSSRTRDLSGEVGALEAAFIGVLDAQSGSTAIYLAPDASPLAQSWAVISQGVVRSASEMPAEWAALIPYPSRLFDAQSQALEQDPWGMGTLAGRGTAGQGDAPAPGTAWQSGWGYALVAGYQFGEDHRVRALLIGRSSPPGPSLELSRLLEGAVLPGPEASRASWSRFPSIEQISDSVTRRGERLEPGPWRLLPGEGAPMAYQAWYAVGPAGRITIPYVALAQGSHLGAGRSFAEGWDNLRGVGAPLPPGAGPVTPLEEARRWMARADSALRVGDWEGFGRAYGALRQALGAGAAVP